MGETKKILYIIPHCSTGGLPAYVVKIVEKMLNVKYDISVVCWSDIAPIFDVQQKILKKLLPNSFYMLYGSDEEKVKKLIQIIEERTPEVCHLQEFPELWAPEVLVNFLYQKDRKFSVVETSHDSSDALTPSTKKIRPDGFAFISHFHANLYKNFGVPWRIVEFPIEPKQRPNREMSLKNLNLNPDLFHVLNVGLFTPRKNQGEIFEIARKLQGYSIQFHFVGNQAGNFEHYWKPLMNNKSENCIIWGERNDVEKFYSCMDLFLFTSKGTVTDRETNPIVLKEALNFSMPILMYNLPVYGGMYDKYSDVYFIDDDLGKTCEILNMVLSNGPVPESHRLRGIYSPNAPIELKVQARVDENPNYTRVYFTPNKDLSAIAALYDYKLDYFLYEAEINCAANHEYWIQMNARKEHLTGVTIRLFKELGEKAIFEQGFDFGNTFDNIIFNKNVKITAPPKKRGWYAYYENIVQKTYEYKSLGVNEGDVCVDLGANLGFATFYMLDCGASKVYSVEADPELFFCMKKNVEGFSVTPIHAAMTGKTGEADFNVYLDTYNCSALNDVGNIHKGAKFQVVKVPALNFDDLIKQHDIEHIDFLKVDIEGAEYQVFLNADREYLKNKISKISMETHLVDTERDLPRKKELIQLLKDCGFHVEIVNPDSINTILYCWKENQI